MSASSIGERQRWTRSCGDPSKRSNRHILVDDDDEELAFDEKNQSLTIKKLRYQLREGQERDSANATVIEDLKRENSQLKEQLKAYQAKYGAVPAKSPRSNSKASLDTKEAEWEPAEPSLQSKSESRKRSDFSLSDDPSKTKKQRLQPQPKVTFCLCNFHRSLRQP